MADFTRGQTYRAGDLPPHSIVRFPWSGMGGHLYRRCVNIPSVEIWGQPIPGSESWQVEYLGEGIEVLPASYDLTGVSP